MGKYNIAENGNTQVKHKSVSIELQYRTSVKVLSQLICDSLQQNKTREFTCEFSLFLKESP